MLATLDFLPSQAPQPVGTDARDLFAGSNARPEPNPNGVKPFPLTPTAFWDTPQRVVIWTQVSPRSPFGIAARTLKLPRKTLSNQALEFGTTLEELALLLIVAWAKGYNE